MQDTFLNLRILAHVNGAGDEDIDLPDETLSRLAAGEYRAAEALEALAARGGVHFEDVGDEGFKPISYTSAGPRIHECIAEEIDKIAKLYAEAVLAADAEKDRFAKLLGFDLDGLRASLNKFEADIDKVATLAETSEALKHLQPEIGRIATNFISVRGVLNHYEDIYRNVLSPIQKEGQKSLRWTAIWGMVGILASTVVSIVLTYLARG